MSKRSTSGNRPGRLRRWWRRLRNAFLISLLVLGLLEVTYRFQWVDFYSPEFSILNPSANPDHSGTTVLIGGDSFSADSSGYVSDLRKQLPQHQILNAAIPGTGIIEAATVLPGRIAHYQPDIFVYQLYVGNDLLDISHPIDFQANSIARNLYWMASDRARSLAFMNYRFGQLKSSLFGEAPLSAMPVTDEREFDPPLYAARSHLYFKAEPNLVSNSVNLTNGREEDMSRLVDELQGLTDQLPETCRIYLLVVPHCAQLNDRYLFRMTQVGAAFPEPGQLLETEFPFLRQLELAYANDERCTVINALPALRARDSESDPVYYANDPHLNPRGKRVLAELLFRELSSGP
ncbi:MAG: hypothetical protein AAGB22_02480 [Bacteroidota bacterium]